MVATSVIVPIVNGIVLAVVIVLNWHLMHLRWWHRAAIRREEVQARYHWRLGEALARKDYDATVVAYAEQLAALVLEVHAQQTWPFRWYRPWRLPPRIGEPWPREDELRPDAYTLQARLFN